MFSIKAIKNVFFRNSSSSSRRKKAVPTAPAQPVDKSLAPSRSIWARKMSASRTSAALPYLSLYAEPAAHRRAGRPSSPYKAAHQRLLTSVRTPGSWGANLELVALARAQGVAIHVVAKDHSAQQTGDIHRGQVQAIINEGGGRSVYLAYDGVHYDALLEAQVSPDGSVRAYLAKSPSDGDCMYHSVATTTVHGATLLPSLMSSGLIGLRRKLPIWRAIFAGEPSISDVEVGKVMQQAYALQMRYDAAKELSKTRYAESAFLQELSGI